MILIESELIENEQNYKKHQVNIKTDGDYSTLFYELYYFHECVLKNADLKYIWEHVVSKRVNEGKETI